MKQHITVEQFMELKDSAKVKLWEWAQAEGRHYLVASEDKQTIYPLLSIGQMIEFLDDSDARICSVPIMIPSSDSEGTYWRVIIFNKSCYSYELCDALWKVVKEVLEKDDVTTN